MIGPILISMTTTVERAPIVHAYGSACLEGTPVACADCGHRMRNERTPLPPCPYYSDLTHPRSGWICPGLPAPTPAGSEKLGESSSTFDQRDEEAWSRSR